MPNRFRKNPGWKPVVSHHQTHGSDPEKGIKTVVIKILWYIPWDPCMRYMMTFSINIPQMLAYIPYMDPTGIVTWVSLGLSSKIMNRVWFQTCPSEYFLTQLWKSWRDEREGCSPTKRRSNDPNLSAAHRHMRLRHSISWLICLLRTDCLRLSQNQNLPPYPWLLPTNPCTGGGLQHW